MGGSKGGVYGIEGRGVGERRYRGLRWEERSKYMNDFGMRGVSRSGKGKENGRKKARDKRRRERRGGKVHLFSLIGTVILIGLKSIIGLLSTILVEKS